LRTTPDCNDSKRVARKPRSCGASTRGHPAERFIDNSLDAAQLPPPCHQVISRMRMRMPQGGANADAKVDRTVRPAIQHFLQEDY